jgi:maltose alpha-D-glucosyltransferase/alpha-amylase
VEYAEGEPQTYVLPLAFAAGPQASKVQSEMPHAVICHLKVKNPEPGKDQEGFLYDPLGERDFSKALLAVFAHRRRLRGVGGELVGWTTPAFHRLGGPLLVPQLEPSLLKAEQSNTSVAYGDRLLLKVFRGVQEGVHPEVEMGRFLTERAGFTHAPPVAGGLDYRVNQGKIMTVAAFLGFVPNEGDAWHFTLDSLRRFYAQALTQQARFQEFLTSTKTFIELVEEDLPPLAQELIGSYLESVRLMGRRTAEFHLALASISDRPDFTPEAFTMLYQRSLYQTVRTQTLRMLDHLRERGPRLPEEVRGHAQQVLQHEPELFQHLRSILERRITAQRMRCHGDYRLNDLLYTGKDFIIIDFEGEVILPLSNRRHKRSPLRDVASLLHSFYFAVRTALKEGGLRPEDIPALEPWARIWHRWVSVAFLKSYLQTAVDASFLPRSREELQLLVGFYVLARGVFEIDYQLLNHPERVDIPLRGLLHILELRTRRPASSPPDRSESDGTTPMAEDSRQPQIKQ